MHEAWTLNISEIWTGIDIWTLNLDSSFQMKKFHFSYKRQNQTTS
jgi:hypothetical protein